MLDCYNHMWIDTDVRGLPHNVVYELYSQPTRGPGEQGSYLVVLPPFYRDLDIDGERYPVIYWLHGAYSSSRDAVWSLQFYAQKMELSKMPKVIIVAPQGLPKGRWINNNDGSRPLGDVMRNNLVAAIDMRYRTIQHPSARWLEGHSAGGYGAFHLGLRYPGVFSGAISSVAGSFRTELTEGFEKLSDTYNGSQEFYTANHAMTTILNKILPPVKRDERELRFLNGSEDVRLRPAVEDMWTTLDTLDVLYRMTVIEGVPHVAERVLGGLNTDGMQFWWDARANVLDA